MDLLVKKKDGEKLIRGILQKVDTEKCPLAGSVVVHPSATEPSRWVEHAKWFEEIGVQTLELNLTLENSTILSKRIQEIVIEIAKNTHIPCYVKITPETGFPGILMAAGASKEAGAKGVVTTGMGLSVPPPDIYGDPPGKTPWTFLKTYPPATIAGPAERFFMYNSVAHVHANFPDLNIEAGAGIVHPEHVVEAIFLGAKTVQSFSGMMWNGINFLTRVNEFLRNYMAEPGFRTIEEFRGFTIKKYMFTKPHELGDYIPTTRRWTKGDASSVACATTTGAQQYTSSRRQQG